MSLQPGSRLGPYEIESALGAGGMGEVYRARDSRLGRHVAIKSLPAAFAQDPERVARFKREAQLLAALNHPHIAGIHGLEEANGSQFLVLEFVDGGTLADRLAKGPIPLAESLRIAREIIDALEAAHEKGIIHRDLKPGNVALTADGQVKVLDFGLARYESSGGEGAPDITHSPTVAYTGTHAGVILGTASYMSPEQARGRPVDKRTDVWAFGCVFFEMLSGRKAFEGQDVADTLAAILRSEPEWAALPADVSSPIRTLIKRCLERERRTRIPDFSVVRFLLDEASQPSQSTKTPRDQHGASGRSTLLPWLVASAFAVMGVVALWAPWRHTPSPSSIRVSAELGGDTSFAARFQSLALSPDGTTIAFVGEDSQTSRHLFIRRLDQFKASALAGTDDAMMPFFSPDGQWVAFFAAQKLKKVAVAGGSVVTLSDWRTAGGGFWGEDGTITFAETSLQRVSASGGSPTPLSALAPGEGMARWPVMLPSGRAVLYSSLGAGLTDWDSGEIVVQKLPDGPRTVLQKSAYFGRYSRSGHILYVQHGTLFAAPFDLEKLEIVGPAVPAAEDVMSLGNGSAQFAISDTGVAAYVSESSASAVAPTLWLDQTGNTKTLRAAPSDWSSPSFSPDGARLAMDLSDGVQTNIWTYDWARDTMSRLTSTKADGWRPSWSPDGRRIAFVSKRSGGQDFYWQRADGAGDAQQLTHTSNVKRGGSFHPNGRFFAYAARNAGGGSDVMLLPIDGDELSGWKPGIPKVLLSTQAMADSPKFSPDGHWLAYASSESGSAEIYVIPFPGPGSKTQISNGDAYDPAWSRVKPELFYASSAGVNAANAFRVMRLPYKVDGESFQAEKPQRWSEGVFASRPRAPSRDFDLHPDGQRVVVAPVENGNTRIEKVSLLFNFFDELKRLTAKK